jgi:hypothetical protein
MRPDANLNRTAWSATVHCLTGCAIGEVAGMVVGTWLSWSNAATVVLSVALAFFFGYALTMRPLLATGMAPRRAAALAFASDTASIATMEVVDNFVMLLIPGAMSAGLSSATFWISLPISLALAAFAAFPVNRWLIGRGMGHAAVHAMHEHRHHEGHKR